MNSLTFFKYTFAAIGVLCFYNSAKEAKEEWRFLSRAIKTKGWITAVEQVRYPEYAYDYPEGSRHSGTLSSRGSVQEWWVGDDIPLYVDPTDPSRSQPVGFSDRAMGAVVLALFGSVSGGIGFGMIFHGIYRGRLNRHLREHGEVVQATIKEVYNGIFSVNGRAAFRIEATAEINGSPHVFKSGYIWSNPSRYLKRKVVNVYYLPGNPKKYHMDTSFLPKSGPPLARLRI